MEEGQREICGGGGQLSWDASISRHQPGKGGQERPFRQRGQHGKGEKAECRHRRGPPTMLFCFKIRTLGGAGVSSTR